MADIDKPTQDISIFSPDGDRGMEVTEEGRGKVETQDINSASIANGKGFSTTTPIIAIAGSTETPFLLLKNPSGSTITIYLDTVRISSGVVGKTFYAKVYRDPTVTANGTALTITKIKKSQTATPQALAYHSPTVSANGTLFDLFGGSGNSNPVIIDYKATFEIEPNESILITIDPESNGIDYAIALRFIEQ